MNNEIYNLYDLVSFNSGLENYFTNKTTNAVNLVYERFLNENINRLKNKDKNILKAITNIHIDYILMDNLNYLWNEGFNTKNNNNTFSNSILSKFKLTEKEKINKNTKLTKTLQAEDIKIAKAIRKRDIEEKKKTLKVLKQDIITSDFGKIYLQERNKEIAKNFTKTYQKKIFDSINNYFNQKYSITREKNLINHLSFKKLNDLSNEEKKEYIEEYNRLSNIYGLNKNSLNTYDSLKYNLKERIRRIATTELSAAYNLARYEELIKQGYTEFIWKTSNKPDCLLCASKSGDIITLEQITTIDRGFTDFKGINTRKNKNAPENKNIIIPLGHPNCRCYLVGNEKTKDNKTSLMEKLNQINNVYKQISVASTVLQVGNSLTKQYLANQEKKKEKEQEDLLKMIIAGGSIMSIAMMYYFFTATNLGKEALTTIEDTVGGSILTETNILKHTAKENIKTVITENLYKDAYKPPTTETLSQYVSNNQKEIINKQISDVIKSNFSKAQLSEILKSIIIDLKGINNLRDLGKTDYEKASYEELEKLLNILITNNKTTNKNFLLNSIYGSETEQLIKVKIPLNIKEPDLVLIQNTENKLISTTTKLERLSVNINNLNNEVKKNKSNYLKDIETLRQLDSELTEQLVGIERINSEYNSLLETTTDKNLSRYLSDKITENNQKTKDLRNKLNNISSDLYGDKLTNVDINLKNDLIKNIKDKGEQYLEFKNNRASSINSINSTLINIKKDVTLDKLSVNFIDEKLNELDKLDIKYKELNRNSLVLDDILGDYAILNKITNEPIDLGYSFNNYLNTSEKRTKQIINVDAFRENSLNRTKVNLDNYRKKLIQTKYKLLNNEAITEFRININNKFNKLCHTKLKNIIEKLKKG